MSNAHARLVCSAPALSRALHVDLGVLAQLEGAIEHCVNVNNDDPKPFKLWSPRRPEDSAHQAQLSRRVRLEYRVPPDPA